MESNVLHINIRPTIKQNLCWQKLRDNTTKFILFGGGRGGCFGKNTLISTIEGYKKIKDINKGDIVLSFDSKTQRLCFNKITNTFKYGCGIPNTRVLNIKFKNGVDLNVTENHKFLYHGKWIEIGTLVRRNMVKCQEYNQLSNKQQRKVEIINIQKPQNNESSKIQERIFTYNHCNKSKKQECKNTHISCRSVHSESQEQTSSKSQRFQYTKQLCRKLGMGNCKRKLRTCKRKKQRKQILSMYGEQGQYSQSQRGTNRNEQIKRISNKRDSSKVQTKKIYQRNVGKRIWCKGFNNKGYSVKKELEACEINLDNIKDVSYIDCEYVYDLEVQNTHNYVVTKNNIIVHNSKSWLICEWLLTMCLAYPGTKYFIARNQLKRLMVTTYVTFNKVCKFHNVPRSLWKLNGQLNYIEFWNGSRIDLLDVAYLPSDPLYERFGSTEYTCGALEEVGEIKEKAFDALKGSIGRQLNKEYNIMSKIFLTCNPKKNWVYTDFYKPWKAGTLPENKCFIQSLYKDNPFTAEEYGENLESIKDPVLKQRLKYGIWEYEEGDDTIMKFDNIVDLFSNDLKEDPESEFYLTLDPARSGRDKAVMMLWQGHFIRRIWWWPKSKIEFLKQKVLSKKRQYHIPMSNIVIDEGGLGGGLIDDPELEGVKGFVDASSPVKDMTEDMQETKKYNYKNLRAQCFFTLAEFVNSHQAGCYPEVDPDVRQWITEELEAVRRKDATNSETTLQIIPKDSTGQSNQVSMKDLIGHSPDFADNMKMRMIFDLGKSNQDVGIAW